MSITKKTKLLIIGSGPAGYTAALYAARANLDPIIITGLNQGGQLMNTTEIENWPTAYVNTSGADLMDLFLLNVKKFNTEIILDNIVNANLSRRPFVLTGDSGTDYICQSVIIATGSSPKKLGIKSEDKFLGKGVSYCATCDGMFYKNKDVIIVGGGNTAIEDALYLSNICQNVTLVHRHEKFRAEPILLDRINNKARKKTISIKTFFTLSKIEGDKDKVTNVVLSNSKNGSSENIRTDGIFIAIGHNPNTNIFNGLMKTEEGYIITQKNDKNFQTMTSIEGVFAAGDVQDNIYRQAITSSGTGCMAALDAQRWLEKNEV
ncbi:thioredoxin reductase (NADPH) [Candidatus Kinetoplastibacterium blastocrithidii TCC012E]|uniref:Thioredoxin reductase n=1 Tax=Candidatus Kinetoplastidibacterium blastocrithidiae TCC012E TaxID=1208922 RepID=M1LWP4_9PROT|nr:thioredoxin-disulfide reductase [Candidatus Kinetoplastibacterium blastocrithidii]AFZ83822.1 Thioredoxin reductase [Candidatus Kinetoplastibacterium blastocrithidii (ex Strigomonas culicis)]AGF49947.1 thioredoxin reductase (NADPH) [Candidatus Kinetoplastibacterium blastocrithidii TCC012E]